MKIFDNEPTALVCVVGALDAANDDHGPQFARGAAAFSHAPGTLGWDPYEIWRSRVRDARRDAVPPAGG